MIIIIIAHRVSANRHRFLKVYCNVFFTFSIPRRLSTILPPWVLTVIIILTQFQFFHKLFIHFTATKILQRLQR